MELKFKNISRDRIKVSDWQPRKDDEPNEQLIESIRQEGLLNPITVNQNGDSFEVMAGVRRLKALDQLKNGNVPCNIKTVDSIKAKIISLQENNVRQNLDELENEKFIYDLWIEGKESGNWISHKEMSEKVNIPQATLSTIIKGHEERLSFKDSIKGEDDLTYDDFFRSRPLEDYPETRKKVLEKRANREIKSQSELHDISKKLAEFPDEEQQLEILDDIEEQEEFSREAFDTIIEKKKEIAEGIRQPDVYIKEDKHERFVDDLEKALQDSECYGIANIDILPKIHRDRAIKLCISHVAYWLSQLKQLGGQEFIDEVIAKVKDDN